MNVVDFKPIPDQSVIDAIQILLDEAKAGEIQSITYVLSFDDKTTGNGWAGLNKNNMAMIAELDILKQEIIDEYVSKRNESTE